MKANNQLTKSLLQFYNASFGGNYEIAGSFEDLEALVKEGWVKYSECRNDSLSTHRASTCRIKLSRMTEKGISEAKEITSNKVDDVVSFLNYLESLPQRPINFYRYLLKQWLKSVKNRREFDWKLRNSNAQSLRSLPLPRDVEDLFSELNTRLVSSNLASYTSLHHTTSGPSSQTLVTCPEIREMLFKGVGWKVPGARGVQHEGLDEYMKYLLNGYGMVDAMDHMLFFFRANNNRFNEGLIGWLSREYGVSEGSLHSFLEELVDNEYVTIISEDVQKGEYALVKGDPSGYYLHDMNDREKIKQEINEKVIRWLESGEETFQRFEFKKYYSQILKNS